MAPKTGKAKPHKAKGDKKKKEDKVLPAVIEITVETPDDSQVTLKGISTDRILDVRKLLGVNVETCHLTNFSLSHEVRGPRLKDSVDIVSLKPCHLTIVEEDYTELQAVAHIRRLLDIVACTTSFGPSSSKPAARINSKESSTKDTGLTEAEPTQSLDSSDSGSDSNTKLKRGGGDKKADGANCKIEKDGCKDVEEKGDTAVSMCPPPRLGQFYDFFSFSHLTPPVQYIRRSTRPFLEDKKEDDFFQIDVRVCSGKPMTIVASRKGFYPSGKRLLLCHSLVSLLQQISRTFDTAYKALMKAFAEHNKFGNLPYGFRANTWVVPPVVADNPFVFPPLPIEDENWGGNGGGQGRDAEHDHRHWAKEFAILAAMPCKTAEERQTRDRKAFLLHSLFVDVSVFKAVAAIKRIIDNNQYSLSDPTHLVLHEEKVGDLIIKVARDVPDASIKLDCKNDGSRVLGLSQEELAKRNLLKGITADESATVHDISTLGVVVIRHCGYTAVVKVSDEVNWEGKPIPQDIDIEEQPEGGANALNVNSLRMLLHKSSTPQSSSIVQRVQTGDSECLHSARSLVRKVLEDSLLKLQEETNKHTTSIRWELGACWVQHLQNQASGKTESNKTEEAKPEPAVKGLGKQGALLKEIKKKMDVRSSKIEEGKEVSVDNPNMNKNLDGNQKELEKKELEMETMWKKLLPEAAYFRLKESETGLHLKSPGELIEMAHKYYADTALPKLVADFGSLELSPVDGRTLTDFMHTRGLQMCSLGRVVELADKLPHVQSLCIHEMIVRAYKHILQAIVAAVNNVADLAASVASCLNILLGTPSSENDCTEIVNDDKLKWKWVETFLLKRFGWKWKHESCQNLRKFAILRGLSHKVGLELLPRDYEIDTASPFKKTDIISMVPVYKHVACSSADGRTLLESSKTFLLFPFIIYQFSSENEKMVARARGGARLQCLSLFIVIHFLVVSANFFKPFNVSYDHRALIIDGQRRMLISGGIHYPRATPEMWPDLIAKSKEGGLDVIQTYVFWNGHEPVKGQYFFEGRYDLVKFVKLVGGSGLYLHLRIGPYVCAEWNFGGFPVWLRDIPGIVFRTNNDPFKEEMQRFVKKIVDLMREEMLFSWQGGPIIMLQIENEYGNIEHSFGPEGREYVKWAARMALGLGAGVPWIMCRQTDAPENIIDACNAYYCDGYKPNSHNKPIFWTEDWDGWYTTWGGSLPHRPVEDLAFAVARFFERGGSFQNYYMYFGGTNFGRTAGGPFYITSYDYDAPIDEYGLLSEPKWGHLKDLHAAIKLCEPALVAADSPQYIKLGPKQEAHVYHANARVDSLNSTWHGSQSRCSAFLANIDERKTTTVRFLGQSYTLPPWSVSILPDCKNVVFNTAKVAAQTSIKPVELALPYFSDISTLQQFTAHAEGFNKRASWLTVKEPIRVWSEKNFTVEGILEHLNVTKDYSDYLWYFTRIYVSDDDLAFWEENKVSPAVTIDSMRDVLRIFINGQLIGSVIGHWVKVVQPVQFQKGYNDLVLLSQTVGLQNYGAFLERDGAGFKGQTKLTGFKDGDIDLSNLSWTYQVGLQGEHLKLYTQQNNKEAEWTDLTLDEIPSTFTWYKTYFDAPAGVDPVALDLGSMGKGQAWVNGHHLGRYWTLVAPEGGCQEICDYRGAYSSGKCTTNCGKPTQTWYHIPRSWLQASNNLLVLFEETGGNPFEISIKIRSARVICAQVSETHYPPLHKWVHPDFIDGNISVKDMTPEMQLQCQDGYIISSIEFASYGTPQGSCQKFSRSNCHAPNSLSVVAKACEGRIKCSISISNAVFGGDPCHGIVKTLAAQARCVSSTKVGSSQY